MDISTPFQTPAPIISGAIFITENPTEANYKVYVESKKLFADLKAFKVESKIFADSPGVWYFTKIKYETDHIVYFTDSKLEADFSICYVVIYIYMRQKQQRYKGHYEIRNLIKC